MLSIKNYWRTFQCPEIDYKLSNKLRFYHRYRAAFAITQITVVTIMNIIPIATGNVSKRILPFFGWFPFDATSSPYFEIIYIIFLLEQLLLILILIACDYCVFYILGTSIYQLDILHYDYENVIQKTLKQFDFFWTNNQNDNLSNRIYNKASEEELLSSKVFHTALSNNLNGLIARHQKLLEFYRRLDKFLMPTITVRLAITSAAFILETVTGLVVRDMNISLPFLQYATTCLIQLLLYGGSGHLLIYKSQNLSEALYDSRWISCKRDIKRSVLLIQQRCSVSSKITIASWMDLTLQTMSSVVRFSFSIATVLRQVLDKK
ncbi:uncharacterized protein LOC108738285 isoform X1 [Agrilus planipennis]|uniref:Uncharacterized protein LOC108738285 isoform X1 n=1 Tax=Agrilus planipennis TaxID=224129 RepID=A0A7F5R869_AGRPL|nr:uncharacterized protein LOC108738285 isoform X1 [Agrilus planipennis]